MKTAFAILLLVICSSGIAQTRKYSKLMRAKSNESIKPPEFPGGEKKWTSFFGKNFNANMINDGLPDSVKEFRDTLVLKFTVTKDSTLQSPQATASVSPHFKQAVFNVLARSPKWIPATSNGQPINATKFYRLCYSMHTDISDIEVIPVTHKEFYNR
jgi:hypothetical protein